MQSHDRRFAGGIVDRQHIESQRAFWYPAFRKEVLRGASQQVLLSRSDA
jgi:hypothetical protein